MIFPSVSCKNPSQMMALTTPNTILLKGSRPSRTAKVVCFNPQSKQSPQSPRISIKTLTWTHFLQRKNEDFESDNAKGFVGSEEMLVLCGVGYWVQGFRCFPWLALNFHMTHALGLSPSTLQLVQNFGNLPMVVKPIYGIFSDAFSIAGAHRIPYICIGAVLQILSWVQLALNPSAGRSLLTLTAFVLIGNLGASVTEVAKDALVAEFGKKRNATGLQSYALMALAAGAILGNLLGGHFLTKTPPRTMFLVFALLLSLQLGFASRASEESLVPARSPEDEPAKSSVSEIFAKQLSELRTAIGDGEISRPLVWIVASIVTVPSLSGSIFCYQTQCLNLDPSVIGMSRMVGQILLLSVTVIYNRYWRKIPMRKLVSSVQILYAGSLLLDLALVGQVNLKLGIPNETFALCFSGLADMLMQFKVLPFSVLLAGLCPVGCEGSLTAFLASALCLSSIVSGCLGIGFADSLGITSGDYSNLPLGILVQFFASLVPLLFVQNLPNSPVISSSKGKRRGLSKRSRRNRRVGRVVVDSDYVFRRERET